MADSHSHFFYPIGVRREVRTVVYSRNVDTSLALQLAQVKWQLELLVAACLFSKDVSLFLRRWRLTPPKRWGRAGPKVISYHWIQQVDPAPPAPVVITSRHAYPARRFVEELDVAVRGRWLVVVCSASSRTQPNSRCPERTASVAPLLLGVFPCASWIQALVDRIQLVWVETKSGGKGCSRLRLKENMRPTLATCVHGLVSITSRERSNTRERRKRCELGAGWMDMLVV
jgi:hypothetical protein